jgi:hypothetical protein
MARSRRRVSQVDLLLVDLSLKFDEIMCERRRISGSLSHARNFAKSFGLLLIGLLLSGGLLPACAQRRPPVTTEESGRSVSSARTINLKAGDDLQKAINRAQPGDTIVLAAGASFTGPFTLPNKGTSSAWITIRTSTPDSALPAAKRVSPSDSPSLPKLLSPGNGQPALQTAPGAHHYRLIGLEIRTVDANSVVSDLITLGGGSSAQSTLAQVPHHLTLDRCLITAFPTQTLRRGIALNSSETTITNCYIAGFKNASQDAQAINGWNGPGPFHIINNYLEGSGENLMFGGGTPAIPGLVPSDIEIRHNYFFKPLSWRPSDPTSDGVAWSVKNLFELKSARRVIFDGNVLENCWGDVNAGYGAINLTVRGDSGPQATIEDVVISNNVMKHTPNGFNLLGLDVEQPSQQGHGIKIVNNLFLDIDGSHWKGNGEFIKISGMPDVSVDHNTVMQSGKVIWVYGAANSGFILTNNIVRHNGDGISGQDQASGNRTLKVYFPGAVVRRNLIVGADFSRYPTDNFYPTVLAKVGLINPLRDDYRLNSDSAYKGKATDGKDIGCDFDALQAATGRVITR